MAIFLGFGSNLGDRHNNITMAIECLSSKYSIKITKLSSFIETEPYGVTHQPDFINAVAIVETNLVPLELLHACLDVENILGRVRKLHWGPRIIDIDLLAYNNQIITTKILTIPHPEIEKRLFVLKSLIEISPYTVHPKLVKTYQEIYNELITISSL